MPISFINLIMFVLIGILFVIVGIFKKSRIIFRMGCGVIGFSLFMACGIWLALSTM